MVKSPVPLRGITRVLGLGVMLAAVGLVAVAPLGGGSSVELQTGLPFSVPPGAQLLTGNETSGCFTDSAEGLLTYDPQAGTTVIADRDVGGTAPIMWRPGFTARRVNDQVEVIDPSGAVVAVTGHVYRIGGGYVSGPSSAHVFWACDFVIPEAS